MRNPSPDPPRARMRASLTHEGPEIAHDMNCSE